MSSFFSAGSNHFFRRLAHAGIFSRQGKNHSTPNESLCTTHYQARHSGSSANGIKRQSAQ
jgi:hypothetical protein